MSVITNPQINYLKELNNRLNANGFSWQHEDYFNLKSIIPEMLCRLCIHSDKNDGVCMECFNEKYFRYYLDEIQSADAADGEGRCTCDGLPHAKHCPQYKNLD